MSLLEEAGLGPEAPGERALAFACRNAPVEVLLVRAADIPEYVQDGVVDCGVTGADLVRERGAEVRELLRLGFGSCTLEAAVPQESTAWELGDLAGLRIATVFPRLARQVLAEREIDVDLVDVTGSVEVAPRLGLADAIIDLVSSGNTLRTNGLRSLGALFSSEAVLIGASEPDDEALQLAAVLRSVVNARDARYLMMNAPEGALDLDLHVWSLVAALRAFFPSRSRGWSPCTRWCRRRMSGACCPSSKQPGRRRYFWCLSSECWRDRCRLFNAAVADGVHRLRVGPVDFRARLPGRSRSGLHRPLRRKHVRVTALLLATGHVAGALAEVNTLSARWLPGACSRRSPSTPSLRPENIVLGAGGDDLILLTARAFIGPGDRAAITEEPTYPLYRIATQLAGGEVARGEPRVTFACRPNNPSGALALFRMRGHWWSTRRTSSSRARPPPTCSMTE